MYKKKVNIYPILLLLFSSSLIEIEIHSFQHLGIRNYEPWKIKFRWHTSGLSSLFQTSISFMVKSPPNSIVTSPSPSQILHPTEGLVHVGGGSKLQFLILDSNTWTYSGGKWESCFSALFFFRPLILQKLSLERRWQASSLFDGPLIKYPIKSHQPTFRLQVFSRGPPINDPIKSHQAQFFALSGVHDRII